MIGIEERTTKTGIHVFRVHYTADPLKRTEEWQDVAAQGMPGGRTGKAWKREMEIDWTVASGLAVYAEEFVRDIHVAKEPIRYDSLLPVIRGWDFGNTPACVWGQLDSFGRFMAIDELVTWDGRGPQRQSNIEAFMPLVIARSNMAFPGAKFIDYADPAGWSKSQTDGRSCVGVMNSYGVYPEPGPMTWSDRNNAMTRALTKIVAGIPAIQISPKCTMLIEGMGGAYKYKEIGTTGQFTDDPEKNAWSHPIDAFHYPVAAVFTPQPQYAEPEPDPEPEVTGWGNRSGMYY